MNRPPFYVAYSLTACRPETPVYSCLGTLLVSLTHNGTFMFKQQTQERKSWDLKMLKVPSTYFRVISSEEGLSVAPLSCNLNHHFTSLATFSFSTFSTSFNKLAAPGCWGGAAENLIRQFCDDQSAAEKWRRPAPAPTISWRGHDGFSSDLLYYHLMQNPLHFRHRRFYGQSKRGGRALPLATVTR